ncbi:MAG: Tryptophanyl-tRNA synthetase [Candidatus Parcubacteria bacterium]|jgi:tryptophanyl-tRNA synthetase
MTSKKRILTGDTPTGKLHIGHYVGTLENRVKLQDEYDTFIVQADLHALTTLNKDPRKVGEYLLETTTDNLAAGLDPNKVTIFAESGIPEIYELAAFFSMYVTHATALRNPTIKDEIKIKGLGDVYSLGFVNYPIYQAADILCVKGDLVPVGVDQLAHLEQSREIARDINSYAGKTIFPEPEGLVGRVGKLVGTDGSPKMSKSVGNTIFLGESPEEVERKVMGMYTDPKRIRATDPGTVEGNPVFAYLDTFGKEKHSIEIASFKDRYQRGAVGDMEVKRYLVAVMNEFLEPIRERRRYYEANPGEVKRILREGTEKTRAIAADVLAEVRTSFGFKIY